MTCISHITKKASDDMTLESKVKFIFGTMIAYGVQITTEVPDHCYDLGVKGQGQICLKSDGFYVKM